MNSFPYYEHYTIKLQFQESVELNENYLTTILHTLCEKLKLSVITEYDFAYPTIGSTKVLLLSQSHLICHAWPQYHSIHIDLISCSKLTGSENFRHYLATLPLVTVRFIQLPE